MRAMIAILLFSVSVPAFAQWQPKAPAPKNFTPTPVQSIACGIPPIPPISCKLGSCVCDQSGTKCSWQFICN